MNDEEQSLSIEIERYIKIKIGIWNYDVHDGVMGYSEISC